MFTGFLGSGKTSMALSFARFLSEQNKKTAFVINEAGDIALDSKLAKGKNFRVEEIFAGCICCQVSWNFVQALDRIKDEEQPDRIIIEPSGIADPVNLRTILERGGYPSIPIINILDLPRLKLLLEAVPVISNGVKIASLIMVNKVDLSVASSDLLEARELVSKLNSEVPIHFVSAKEGVPKQIWQEVAHL
jgi:G3E family GTPase